MQKLSGKLPSLLDLMLIALTVVAFEGVRHNGFVYDDSLYVTQNAKVQAGLNGESIAWALTTTSSGNWQPLTWLSHIVDTWLFGLDASGHHIVSLLFHILNVVLLFRLFTRMTGQMWPSVLVAAFFAVHPLRVESVAWVAERKDVLSGLLWILTTMAYVRYTERPGIMRYGLVMMLFALGLMAKPMLVTLPFALLLLDYWPLGRLERHAAVAGPGVDGAGGDGGASGGGAALHEAEREHSGAAEPAADDPEQPAGRRATWARVVLEKVWLLPLTIVFSIATAILQRSHGAMGMMESGRLPLALRVENVPLSYVKYVLKTVLPTKLAVLYPHPGENIQMWAVIVSSVVLIAATAGILRMGKARPYLTVGWLWFLGTLVPVIGIIQVGGHAIADRFTYIPSIGLAVMVAWSVASWARTSTHRIALAASLATAVLALLVLTTRAYVGQWKNSITLYSHAAAVTTDNWLAHYNLGRAEILEGNIAEGVYHLRETIRILPGNVDALNNLGVALMAQGDFSGAVAPLEEAVRLRPGDARAQNNLGQALALNGRYAEAVESFRAAVALNGNFPKAHYNLAAALDSLGRLREALANCEEALRLRPDYPEASALKASILARLPDE